MSVSKAFDLVHGNLGNYPEVNSGWIRCTKWGYFRDAEGNLNEENPEEDFQMEFAVGPQGDYVNKSTPKQTIRVSDVVAGGFEKMLAAVTAGGLRGYFPNGEEDFWDECCWDADSIDGLMQFHFYGDVLCG